MTFDKHLYSIKFFALWPFYYQRIMAFPSQIWQSEKIFATYTQLPKLDNHRN